jgi:hypothetical protein
LPQYRNSLTGGIGNIITVPHPLQDFEEIFLCWHNSSKANAEKLLEQVNKTFGMMATDGKMYKLAYVIRPNDILVKYHMMSSSSELRLLDVDYYKPIFEKYSQKTLNEFLDSLCFQLRPSLKQIEQDIRPEQVKSRITITGHPGFTYTGKLTYRTIYGLEEYIHGGHKKHKYSSELSHYVWDLLCLYSNDLFKDNARIRYQPYCDYRYNPKYITYPNPLIELLTKYPWIHVSKNDKFIKIKDLFLEDFVENGYQYDAKLMEVLQIISSPKAIEREQIQGMSPETQATFAMGEKASEYFKNKDEMARALELLNEEKAKNAEKERRNTAFTKVYEHGPIFASSNYGTLELKYDGSFIWKNFKLLVPSVIPAGTKNVGFFTERYALSKNLKENYDGILTFKFDGLSKEINFLYKLEDGALRMEDATCSEIDGNLVKTRSSSPLILYFKVKVD